MIVIVYYLFSGVDKEKWHRGSRNDTTHHHHGNFLANFQAVSGHYNNFFTCFLRTSHRDNSTNQSAVMATSSPFINQPVCSHGNFFPCYEPTSFCGDFCRPACHRGKFLGRLELLVSSPWQLLIQSCVCLQSPWQPLSQSTSSVCRCQLLSQLTILPATLWHLVSTP